jgi:hypothetical protein
MDVTLGHELSADRTHYRNLEKTVLGGRRLCRAKGRHPPGGSASRLSGSEQEIAAKLNMSRTPVHEAIIRLQSEGLVKVLSKRGVFICTISPDDMREIYDVIIACKCTLARWRSNALCAGGAEQIPAKARMAYRGVADDIDERGLAGSKRTFERRAKLLRPLDVLTVTIHQLEYPVVALVW